MEEGRVQDRPSSSEAVFVSYSREDAGFAQPLVERLRAEGITVRLDQDLQAGEDWQHTLETAIRACSRLIVVLSPRSVASYEVRSEWSFALDEGCLVVPVLFERCKIPMRLRTLQYVDFSKGEADSAFLRLLSALAVVPSSTLPPFAREGTWKPPGQTPKLLIPGAGLLIALSLTGWLFLRGSAETHPKPSPLAAAAEPLPAASPRKAMVERETSDEPEHFGWEMLETYRTATNSRSQLLRNVSRWRAAAAIFDKERKSAPPEERQRLLARSEFCRGKAELLEGKLAGAEKLLQSAHSLDSEWAPPLLALSSIYTRQEKFPPALDAARKALEVEPHFWLAQIALGPIYAAQGDFHDAIRVYLDAVPRQSSSAREAAGVDAGDASEFEQIYDTKEARPFVLGNLALTYHVSRQHDRLALHLAELALTRDPELTPALIVVAERKLEDKDSEGALRATEVLVRQSFDDVAGWLIHGDALLAQGRDADAKRAFERALEEYEETQSKHAPKDRLNQVRAALGKGELPPPRGPTAASAGPSPRSVPPPRTSPRPAPAPPAGPASRTTPSSIDLGF